MANHDAERRHQLSRDETKKGADNGRATRVNRAAEWDQSFVQAMHALAVSRSAFISGLTNNEIADLLKQPPHSIQAPRGGELIGKHVQKALVRVRISRAAIKRWRRLICKKMDEWQLDDDDDRLMLQLWHEWLRHESERRYFRMHEGENFEFEPVHPHHWVKPWVRDNNAVISLCGPPPNAHIVQALMGRMDPHGDDKAIRLAQTDREPVYQDRLPTLKDRNKLKKLNIPVPKPTDPFQ